MSVNDVICNSVLDTTNEPDCKGNTAVTEVTEKNVFLLDINKLENFNTTAEGILNETKKRNPRFFQADDNANDGEILKVHSEILENDTNATKNTSKLYLCNGELQSADTQEALTKATENTEKFHLHYEESQSADIQGLVTKATGNTDFRLQINNSQSVNTQRAQAEATEDTEKFHLHYEESQSADTRGVLPKATENTADFKLQLDDSQSACTHEEKATENIAGFKLQLDDPQSSDRQGILSKATENTADLKLQLDDSQSPDKPVPWYKNLQPPSPMSEEEKVEEKVGNDEVVSEEETTIDKGKNPVSNAKLTKLARKSLPALGDITKIKPRLSGAPDDVIDLDEDKTVVNKGVLQLMQRFIKHSVPKHQHKEKEKVEIG